MMLYHLSSSKVNEEMQMQTLGNYFLQSVQVGFNHHFSGNGKTDPPTYQHSHARQLQSSHRILDHEYSLTWPFHVELPTTDKYSVHNALGCLLEHQDVYQSWTQTNKAIGKQLHKPHYIYSVECHEAGGLFVVFVYLMH